MSIISGSGCIGFSLGSGFVGSGIFSARPSRPFLVKTGAAVQEESDHACGQDAQQPALKIQLEKYFSFKGQGNVVPGKVDLLETIAVLEFRKGAAGLIAVSIFAVKQVSDLAFFTNLDGSRNQSVGRPLIIMLIEGNDVQNGCNASHIDQLDEPDQLVAGI